MRSQVLGRPCPAGVSAAARRGALVPPPAGFSAMPMHVPPALRGGFVPSAREAFGQKKIAKPQSESKPASKIHRGFAVMGVWGEPAARSNWNSRGL